MPRLERPNSFKTPLTRPKDVFDLSQFTINTFKLAGYQAQRIQKRFLRHCFG